MSHLQCVELEPAGPARTAVVWLHGLGADGHDFEPIVPHLGLDRSLATRFVFPHAPRRAVTINMGLIMPAWYDIRTLGLEDERDDPGIDESVEQVRALIAREQERGIATTRLVLAGFSQGGAIALEAALTHPERLAGVVALSAYLVRRERGAGEVAAANRGMKVFLAHGTADPMVPYAFGEATRERLGQLGCEVEWRSYAMGHEVHPGQIRDLGAWLGERLRSADEGDDR